MAETFDKVQNLTGSQDYGSEFEYDSEAEARRKRRSDLAYKKPKEKTKVASKQEVTEEFEKDEGRRHRLHFLALDAYSRHKKLVNDYVQFYGGSVKDFKTNMPSIRTDHDVIKDNHQFMWSEEEAANSSWEKRLSKKYWDKLFKEYCIAELGGYKENKVGMRWRIEAEVLAGKGQFVCGAKSCSEDQGLRSWEVNFGYIEQGVKKSALVKLRLCPSCSYRLNYRHRRKEVLPRKRRGEEGGSEEGHIKIQKVELTDPSSHRTPEGSTDPDRPSVSKTEDSSGDNTVWSQPAKPVEEKRREDEFDDYLADMFL